MCGSTLGMEPTEKKKKKGAVRETESKSEVSDSMNSKGKEFFKIRAKGHQCQEIKKVRTEQCSSDLTSRVWFIWGKER